MKTYKIEPAEKTMKDEKGKETVIVTAPEDRVIEIKGDVREEFSVKDLLNQISLVEGQIKNIKRAGENKPQEIASLLAEMEKYKDKIDEVNKEFSLKLKLPTVKTEKKLSDELVEEKIKKETIVEEGKIVK